ncbi:hypothetical protein JXB41_08000 [Candidatus Woesearchaeota archaeon]|nr:hypothetical protein [Candidatus Woesearchaeota archaeon]
MSYVSIINSGMILFMVLSNLEKYGIDIDIARWFFPILFLGILGLVFLGFIEDRLGFYRTEIKTSQKRNPQMNEILRRLDRIEKKIK